VLAVRDPFPVFSVADTLSSATDGNTRVLVFALNLQLAVGEPSSAVVINLVDSSGQSFEIAAEDVRAIPGMNFSQVIFRLPNSLSAGTCTVTLKAHNQVSAPGRIKIKK
jgi:hypothetical protein